VQSREANAFTDEDVAILQTMADQVALAIQNARLMDDLERAVRELEIAQGEYVEKAWQDVAGDAGWVSGYRYRHTGLEVVADQPPEALQAWQEGQSVITTGSGRGNGQDLPPALAVPMKLRGQVVGVLNLRFDGQSISSETIGIVEEIADRLALALENARLLEHTKRRAARERVVADITAQVRASSDVETIMRTAVRELGKALNADRTRVQLAVDRVAQGEPGA
jgi:GAF domain-containing protein